MTDWACGSLPESVDIERAGIRLKGFPALVDCGDSVAVRVLDSDASARAAHREGLRRLLMLALPQQIRFVRKHLPNLERMRLQYAKAPAATQSGGPTTPRPPRGIEDELVFLAVDLTFLEGRPDVRDGEVFARRVSDGKAGLAEMSGLAAERVGRILDRYQEARKALSAITAVNWLPSLRDMQQQLDGLIYQGFLQQVSWERLAHYPRYLAAITARAEKLAHAAARDRKLMDEMQPLYADWRARNTASLQRGERDPRLEEVRWLFEELRVSLFAQELGTAHPVSMKRIRKRWEALGL
jgi:ATP-dependent helicase HrpA